MNEFAQMILSELMSSIAEAVAVCVLAVMGVGAYYFHHKRKYQGQRKFPWLRTLLILALVGYLVMVDYATVGRLSGNGVGGVNLHLFRAWREAWNSYSVKSWLNVLLNIAMFLPLGVLLPLIWKSFRKWYWMLAAGFAVSMFFELSQYITGRGILDVDDLFANTLGAMMGFFPVMAVLQLFREKGRRLQPCIAWSVLALIPVCAISGIFLAYHMQEYGNLPEAPSCRANTRDVEFSLECTLPEDRQTAPVYRTQTLTQEECDLFGREFEQLAQAYFHEVLYYDKETYFIDRGLGDNGAHFLLVSWLDGSYEYTHLQSGYDDPEILWCEAERDELETLLGAYPVVIPAQAEFAYEENGWHSFRADRLADGERMLDGFLRCRFGSGQIWEIDNRLVSYAFYRDEPVLSPEEAFTQLTQGRFSGADSFEHYAPNAVSVLSCELGYRIDTKGFYQPVYLFSLAGTDYSAQVLIPALA